MTKKMVLRICLSVSLVFFGGAMEARAHEKNEFYPQLVICKDYPGYANSLQTASNLNELLQPPLGVLRVLKVADHKIMVGTKSGYCRSTMSAPSFNTFNYVSSACVTVTTTCSPQDLGDRFDELLEAVHEHERIATEKERLASEQEAERIRTQKEQKQAGNKERRWFGWSTKKHDAKGYSTVPTESVELRQTQ